MSSHHKNETEAQAEYKFWWSNVFFVVLIHIIAMYALLFYRPDRKTVLLTICIWQAASIGITMGYHRLWSHRAFKSTRLLSLFLLLCGTLGFQGSALWWVKRHRLHHRFTDTENDPYNAKKGFWWSHMGWIFWKVRYQKMTLVDVRDLQSDLFIRLQHKFYVPLAIFLGFFIPTYICSFWDDWAGGLLYGGMISRLMIWHCTFAINSFAHWIGDQEFTAEITARGHWLLAVMTAGEGHHNFHHEFPSDYRNGVYWYQYDLTKWLILLCSYINLTKDLMTYSEDDINRTRIQFKLKRLQTDMADIWFGPDSDTIPELRFEEFMSLVEEGRQLVILDGYAVDISSFHADHPGGSKILETKVGTDITTFFYGTLNNHSNHAKIKAHTLKIARIIRTQCNGAQLNRLTD